MADEELFPGNANRNKEKKEVKMVVSKPAKRKKKSALKRVSEKIFEDDDGEKISDLVVHDILIPSAKDTASTIIDGILDAVKDMAERFIFGSSYGPVRKHSGSSRYSDRYKSRYRSRDRESRYERTSRNGVDDVIFETREEAQDVLDLLLDSIEEYNEVSVSDYYDAAGVTSGDFTDNKYGWDNLKSAKIGRSKDGYFLKLPRPIYLDD